MWIVRDIDIYLHSYKDTSLMAEEITIVQHETGLFTYLLPVVESRVLSRQSFLQGTKNSPGFNL